MKKYSFPKHVCIIAEIGVNHNGSENTAIELIKKAKKCGADVVKFQLFSADSLITKSANKPQYIKTNKKLKSKSQFQILKKLELPIKSIKRLRDFCKKIDIEFLISPFDIGSIQEIKKLRLNVIKIPSGEINNYPYLREIGKLNKRVILSTGMSNLNEIKRAIHILQKFGTKKNKITLLHCTTDYPTKAEDVNLSAMITMREKLKTQVGYSDHTNGTAIAIAAATLGACIIEKHFTLNKNMNGPDHKASLEPTEFSSMVKSVREVSQAFGHGKKIPTSSEMKNINLVRKSIVAKRNIKKDELFNEENITTKRPGSGISPMKWNQIIGKKSKRKYNFDDIIKE